MGINFRRDDQKEFHPIMDELDKYSTKAGYATYDARIVVNPNTFDHILVIKLATPVEGMIENFDTVKSTWSLARAIKDTGFYLKDNMYQTVHDTGATVFVVRVEMVMQDQMKVKPKEQCLKELEEALAPKLVETVLKEIAYEEAMKTIR